jgi:hypothetical protein
MIAVHTAGIQHDYKNINRTPGKCFVSGEYSDQEIMLFWQFVYS